MPNLFKKIAKRWLVWQYHRENGPALRYHGIEVKIPRSVPFAYNALVARGGYEEAERSLFAKYFDPAVPVIELGGSLGILSAYIAQQISPETPYWVIEANPKLIEVCKQNANSRPRPVPVRVLHCAVAYGTDSVSFRAKRNIHVSRLATGNLAGNITVPARKLSDLVDEMGANDGYTLVMDIEGAEYDVFENDAATLAKCRLAIVETHPRFFKDVGRSMDDFMAMVEGAGLRVLEQNENTIALAPK